MVTDKVDRIKPKVNISPHKYPELDTIKIGTEKSSNEVLIST